MALDPLTVFEAGRDSYNPLVGSFRAIVDRSVTPPVLRFQYAPSGTLAYADAFTLTAAGQLDLLRFAQPLNVKAGQVALVAGSAVVPTTAVAATSLIFLSRAVSGGTPGNLTYTPSVGVSFTIASDNPADTSTINWWILDTV